ncbi:OmpH family outer membrane protein [Novosphingobium aerophilum]|uniref:OmpH family outer membrane protein n=1 Tax=Novosphingobium aerophilum TaxID=2839843 RepID=A0A7X1KAV2_9SPHN|nr:OmpH family outer membrane protein [Novosphingobium aerophilum]MBC2650616.1 OmpH family outer membrane protein [Novosphingobium aerophilum]
MSKYLIPAAVAATLAAVSPVQAQQAVAPAKVAVVDLDRITRECNACKTAAAALQQQVAAYESRAQQLQSSLGPEAQYLDGALKALGGKEPDAALKTRIETFQRNQQAAAQELQGQQQTIQRNQAYVREQLLTKLQGLYVPTMTKRGATVLIEVGTTLAYDPQFDVTNDLLAAVNASLTSLQAVAPAQPAQGQAPAAPAAPRPTTQTPPGR